MFTLARIKKSGRDTLPQQYQEYVVFKDGKRLGYLRYDRGRWKSAGGPAWEFTVGEPGDNGRYTYYEKTHAKILLKIKDIYRDQ